MLMRHLTPMALTLALALWGCDDGDGGSTAGGAGGSGGSGGELAGGAGGEAGGGAGGEVGGGAGGEIAGGAGGAVGGCVEVTDCEEGEICYEGRCVGCRDDSDCVVTTVCEMDQCVPGCRDDDGCEAGAVCEAGACVAGCREDAGCGEGEICEDGACLAGCREDAGCAADAWCQDATCVPGCHEDAGCALGEICLDHGCLTRGVACREDGDCAEGDTCDEGQRCVAGDAPCTPDALEGEIGEVFNPAESGTYRDLRICPEDEDLFLVTLAADDTLTVDVAYNTAEATLVVELFAGETAQGNPVATADAEGHLSYMTAAAGRRLLRIRGEGAETRASYSLTVNIAGVPMCVDVTVYADEDGDGYGAEDAPQLVCLDPGEDPPAGTAAMLGDCGVDDPLRYPMSPGVCGDNVDDDCDSLDEACPASAPAVQVPDWRCEDDAPPANVAAWARFDDGQGYFNDGGCFVFFEGTPGTYFVARHVDRANPDPSCEDRNGCTCPSLNGWPSYDRRMYAFTRQAVADEACPELSIRDHGGEDQPVSNACRKYLYQMHFYDIPFSYVAPSYAALQRRLSLYPTVEIACVQDSPHANLPFQSLVSASIQYNDAHQPQD